MQPVSRTSRYMNKALVAINFRMIKALVACRCRMAKVLVAGKFRSTSHHTVAHSYSTAVASSYCLPLQHIQALSQASVCFFFLTGALSDTAFPVSRTSRSRANFASKFRKTTSLVASIFRMITALVASKFRMVKALIASKFRSTSHHNVDDLYPPAVASSYRLPSEHFRVLSRAPQRCLCCLPLPLNVAYRYTDALLTVHLLLVEIHFAMNRDDSTFGTPAQPATSIGAYHHIRICDFWGAACEFFFGSTDASGDGKWASWQRTRASWWHTRAACRRHPRQRGGDLGRCSRSCRTLSQQPRNANTTAVSPRPACLEDGLTHLHFQAVGASEWPTMEKKERCAADSSSSQCSIGGICDAACWNSTHTLVAKRPNANVADDVCDVARCPSRGIGSGRGQATGRGPPASHNVPFGLLFAPATTRGAALRTRSLVVAGGNGAAKRRIVEGWGACAPPPSPTHAAGWPLDPSFAQCCIGALRHFFRISRSRANFASIFRMATALFASKFW